MTGLKELFAAIGINLEIHNIIVDFRTPEGRSAHQAYQAVANGVKCPDADIVERIRAALPAGSRLCSVHEVMIDCELSELEKLADSIELINCERRILYLDRELAREYIQEVRRGDMG